MKWSQGLSMIISFFLLFNFIKQTSKRSTVLSPFLTSLCSNCSLSLVFVLIPRWILQPWRCLQNVEVLQSIVLNIIFFISFVSQSQLLTFLVALCKWTLRLGHRITNVLLLFDVLLRMLLNKVVIKIASFKDLETNCALHPDSLICHSLTCLQEGKLQLWDLLHIHLTFLNHSIANTW